MMSESAMSDPTPPTPPPPPPPQAKRAGFWGRAGAFVVDLLAVNILVAVVGLAATGLSGGSVRVANTLDDVRHCGDIEPLPPDLSVPREFSGGDMRRCTRSLYGFAYDRMLVVQAMASRDVAEDDRQRITIPVDADGRPMRAFYLDSLTPLVLAVYLLLLEWRYGATLGMGILGIRVVARGGGPIDVVQAGKRSLIRALVVLCSAGTQMTYGFTTAYGLPDLGLWSRMLDLLALGYLIIFAIATLAGFLPPHDRWARTDVVRRVPA
jgi:uncharacterized RDD family membrane protein YckC